MSWRGSLRKASFRGVEFLVDGVDGQFGRRTVTHEYPLRDKPYVEDLGRKARAFTIEAYVLATPANGLNYMPARDALIAALEQAGPGVLIHPYLGELRVSLAGEARLRETSAQGGKATFTLNFVEAGEVLFPSARASTPSIVNTRADEAAVVVQKDFEKKFSLKGLPEFVTKGATGIAGNATKLLGDVTKLVPVDAAALPEYLKSVAAANNSITALAKTPLDFSIKIVETCDQLRTIAKDPLAAYGISNPKTLVRNPLLALKMLRKLLDFGKPSSPYPNPPVPLVTPARMQESQNQDAMAQLVQRAAVISATRSAAETDFATFDDANAVRTELADKLDELMAGADADEVYLSLANLRAASVKDITARGADLGRLVEYTPAESLPALVLAYQLYDDAGRDEEIVLRNAVRHPGFVPGGRTIEVLADA